MGYVIPLQFSTNNIQLHKNNPYYIIRYNLDYLQLSGISLCLQDIFVKKSTNGYNLYIQDKDTIQQLQEIDDYFCRNVPKYRPILQKHQQYYIYLKENKYTSQLNTTYKLFHINLVKLKIGASYTHPIVYIIE